MMNDTRELHGKGFTYVITRRFIPGTGRARMRVRVRIYEGFRYTSSKPVTNEYRDYDDMHTGDATFAGHIAKINAHINSK
jgi:hypothetical protein